MKQHHQHLHCPSLSCQCSRVHYHVRPKASVPHRACKLCVDLKLKHTASHLMTKMTLMRSCNDILGDYRGWSSSSLPVCAGVCSGGVGEGSLGGSTSLTCHTPSPGSPCCNYTSIILSFFLVSPEIRETERENNQREGRRDGGRKAAKGKREKGENRGRNCG